MPNKKKEESLKMKTHLIMWTIGYPSMREDYNCWRAPVRIKCSMEESELIRYLELQFYKDCLQMFDIRVDEWFAEQEDNFLPDHDFDILVKERFLRRTANNIFTPTRYFSVWCDLLKRVRPDFSVQKVSYREMTVRGGWGLVFS